MGTALSPLSPFCPPPHLVVPGKVVHSMVAHLDAVTCLAVDPNGVFLMSGSKWPWPCP